MIGLQALSVTVIVIGVGLLGVALIGLAVGLFRGPEPSDTKKAGPTGGLAPVWTGGVIGSGADTASGGDGRT